MPCDEGLLDEQREAVKHSGCHCRLLAGPGTGKTLTLSRHVACLLCHQGVDSGLVLALTFTRVAANQLRQQVSKELQTQGKITPPISTLHSFALRQLLRNSNVIKVLPKPLRIADDWEERYIIQEDIKDMVKLQNLKDARDGFAKLSADWETLASEDPKWESNYPDPAFLGAWKEHRSIYGYTLRSELVYQLKRALEQEPGFKLEQDFKHVLVDEYQDLNKCDLAIIKNLTKRGAELFCAGDDDQSIYGFRYAYPEGIRQFDKDYSPSRLLGLSYCMRCDKKIIELGEFIAKLDYKRPKSKAVSAGPKALEGDVEILWFDNQVEESNGIAAICQYLISSKGVGPSSILILLRSDLNGAYSNPIRAALESKGIPVSTRSSKTPIDENDGRLLLALLRLSSNYEDSLSWRTLLNIRSNKIGNKTVNTIYQLAGNKGIRFFDAIKLAPDSLPSMGKTLQEEVRQVSAIVELVKESLGSGKPLIQVISDLADSMIKASPNRDPVVEYLAEIVKQSGAEKLEDFIIALSSASETLEQEVESGKVNVLTMHKAKGLSADVVFLAAAEDERIPGENPGDKLEDERRLLYVSLTRAKHSLFVTYCNRRTGQQSFQGGKKRTLTRFLRDAPIRPKSGNDYIQALVVR